MAEAALTNERQTVKIDRESVLEGTDIVSIAQSLGLRTSPNRSGRRVGMLCPMHSDKHFGSCFLETDKQRFYCFVCHRGGNAVDLVMAANGWDRDDGKKAVEAMKYIASLYGRDVGKVSKKVGATKVRIPKEAELEKIGLFNEPVYAVAGYTWEPENDARMDKESCRVYPSEADGREAVAFIAEKNPLRELAETDPEGYRHLLCRKSLEKEAEWVCLRERIKHPKTQYNAEEYAVLKEIISNGALNMLLLAIEEKIFSIRQFRAEYCK